MKIVVVTFGARGVPRWMTIFFQISPGTYIRYIVAANPYFKKDRDQNKTWRFESHEQVLQDIEYYRDQDFQVLVLEKS